MQIAGGGVIRVSISYNDRNDIFMKILLFMEDCNEGSEITMKRIRFKDI